MAVIDLASSYRNDTALSNSVLLSGSGFEPNVSSAPERYLREETRMHERTLVLGINEK